MPTLALAELRSGAAYVQLVIFAVDQLVDLSVSVVAWHSVLFQLVPLSYIHKDWFV
jgi:hypothetical protein